MARVNILGVSFDALTMESLIKKVPALIKAKKGSFIVTANPEIVMHAKKDPEFAEIIDQADLVTADGIGVILAAKIMGQPLPERVTGIEIITNLFTLAQKEGYTFYFLGAKPGVAEAAAQKVKQKYPRLNIVGVQHGYFQDEEAVLADIKTKKPDILLVALGMGRQEKWIWQYKGQLQVPLSIGVGGSFDVLAGKVKRAPLWMQRLGIEWLFRLLQEPSRYKRMVVLPYFLAIVITKKFRGENFSGSN